ncbi:MAG: DNA-directed polymerase specialized sigma subunit, sigma24 [Gemmataceae bacterium]|nr:DNA-directed polymerase specialized sigma subunit, sigma24 [Gemmataceae bacterium]
MVPVIEFEELIRRVRRGDHEAARVLVEQYESVIRRVVRFRLTDPRLRAAFDSMDVCRSVLGSFFVRAANGEYELDEPGQLSRLLVGIARNKLVTHARKLGADKRDYRRTDAGADQDALAGQSPSPSRHAAAKELLEAVRGRLTAEERELPEMRQQGLDWAEIAGRVGDNPVAVRKRFSRTMDRVARELGLDDPDG